MLIARVESRVNLSKFRNCSMTRSCLLSLSDSESATSSSPEPNPTSSLLSSISISPCCDFIRHQQSSFRSLSVLQLSRSLDCRQFLVRVIRGGYPFAYISHAQTSTSRVAYSFFYPLLRIREV